MNKRIAWVMMAGVVMANAVGSAGVVKAEEVTTDYPENTNKELLVTMIDPRHNTLTMAYTPEYWRNGKFKGVKFFGGDISEELLIETYPGENHGEVEYLRYEPDMESWEELANGEEKTFTEMTRDLTENTSGVLAFYFQYLAGWSNPQMNYWKGRVNYSRCSDSDAYRLNPAVVCRAEVWDDGMIHYQPYIGWDRLFLPDDPEGVEEQVRTFRDGAWVMSSSEEGEGDEGDGGEGAGDEGDGGEGTGDEGDGGDGGESGGESEVVYVEVPVEKIVLKEIVKEVPIESTVVKEVVKEVPVEVVKETVKEVPVEKVVEKKVVEQVEVQVPVESTVVKEVPVETQVAVGGGVDYGLAVATIEGGEDAVGEGDGESEDAVGEGDGESEDAAGEGSDEDGVVAGETEDVEDIEGGDGEETELGDGTVEVPELGGEKNGASGDLAGKVATFIAGLISAAGLLLLAVVYRRKKQNPTDAEQNLE